MAIIKLHRANWRTSQLSVSFCVAPLFVIGVNDGGLRDVVKVAFPRRFIVRVSMLEVIKNGGYELIVPTVFEDIGAD